MEAENGAKTVERSPRLDRYRDYYANFNFFRERPGSGCPADVRWEIVPGHGNGYSGLYQLGSGPCVGVCAYQLKRDLAATYRDYGETLKFSLMYSGSFTAAECGGGETEIVRGGDVWFCPGRDSEVFCVQPAEQYIAGVSLEISRGMLDAWLGGFCCELSRTLEKYAAQRKDRVLSAFGGIPKARSLPVTHPAMRAARRLFTAPRSTVVDMLHFESLALDLLHKMLTLDEPEAPRPCECRVRRQRAADEARDILDTEWGSPPTISALARRVGINECYLKKDFRNRTGLSIGAYVRRLRMEKALRLIESGRCSVLQAAMMVGYSNPSHFSRAFKQFHGRLPSAFLPRA